MIPLLHNVLALTRPLIGLDLETTGVVAKTSGICSMALEIMIPGQPVKEYSTLINPLLTIPASATAVHGITNEMVQGAPTFRQLASNLLSGMTNVDFAGYNVWFDLAQMVEEFKRCAIEWSYETSKIVDGYRIWQIAEERSLSHAVERWLRGGSAYVNDAAIIDELNAIKGGPHTDALWDIKMSTRVIAAQLTALPHLPRTVEALHKICFADRFDVEGKLKWVDGELCFGFGKHRNQPLRIVPRQYLIKFIGGADFSPLVKQTCKDAANGIFPVQPNVAD